MPSFLEIPQTLAPTLSCSRLLPVSAFAALAIVLGASRAVAQDHAEPRPSSQTAASTGVDESTLYRGVALELMAGAGLPTGTLGLALDWSASENFALEAGAGWSAQSKRPHFVLGGRGRLLLTRKIAIALGAGLSFGPFTDASFPATSDGGYQTVDYDGALFLNLLAGPEMRLAQGSVFRVLVGSYSVLYQYGKSCDRDCISPAESNGLIKHNPQDYFVFFCGAAVGINFST